MTPSVRVLFPGETLQLSAALFDDAGAPLRMRPVSWSSSDDAIATVDVSGLVTAQSANGQAVITATSEGVTGEAIIVVPVAFESIVAGATHSCGATVSGEVYCWGRNQEDVLGAGGGPDSMVPQAVSTSEALVTFSALTIHTCARNMSGEAFCWGSNRSGQIGNGLSSGTSASPARAGAPRTFDQISAGGSHTCARTSTGQVFCWGDNDYGQLGDGTFDQSSTPTQVIGGHTFDQLATGGTHSCGLDAAGVLRCWGRNDAGQLGIANMNTNLDAPTQVDQAGPFTHVAAGPEHTCAITSAGATYCWGGNSDGQLGQSTQGSDSPAALLVGGNHTFVTVFAGTTHSCGLEAGGALWCWGANNNGQLGDGTNVPSATPVQVSGGHSFAQVDAGNLHNCAIDLNGVAYCWGSNSEGRLGNGTNVPSLVPYPVIVE